MTTEEQGELWKIAEQAIEHGVGGPCPPWIDPPLHAFEPADQQGAPPVATQRTDDEPATC